MAPTLRLPKDLEHQLADLAEREHSSKHSLMVESVDRLLEERDHRAMVEEGLAYALEHDAKTLERLADLYILIQNRHHRLIKLSLMNK